MKNHKGFSLVELQISMLVAAVLVVAIGTVAGMSTRSYNRLLKQSEVHNQISYVFKIVQNRIHACDSIEVDDNPASPWVGEKLIVDNEAFGFYSDGARVDFVHLTDFNNPSTKRIIFTKNDEDDIEFNFTVDPDPDPEWVTIELIGQRDEVELENLETIIMRRMS